MPKFRGISCTAIAGLITVAAAASAGAQITFGVGAGSASPTGNLSNAYTTGYNVLADLGVRAPAFPLGFRLDGMFDQMPVKAATGFTGNTQIFSLTANAVLTPVGDHIVTPYLIGGGGYYNDHYHVAISGTTAVAGGSTTDNNFGLNGGVGVKFGVSSLGLFLEARYHYVFDGPGHYSFVPLTAGIVF